MNRLLVNSDYEILKYMHRYAYVCMHICTCIYTKRKKFVFQSPTDKSLPTSLRPDPFPDTWIIGGASGSLIPCIWVWTRVWGTLW
jgi:hypothetical protein